MEIFIRDRKLKASLEDDAKCRKRFGKEMAMKLRLRMDALRAAESLADFWPPLSGPERCHLLKGTLAGNFSVDVRHPYRLLFEALGDHDLKTDDAKKLWQEIRSIEIIGIEDTHD